MARISKDAMNAIDYAIRRTMRDRDTNCSIYEIDRNPFKDGKVMTYGVNWSATGTQNIEETLRMSDNLKFAAEIADELNRLELVLSWDDSEVLETKEKYDGFEKRLYEALMGWDAVMGRTPAEAFGNIIDTELCHAEIEAKLF